MKPFMEKGPKGLPEDEEVFFGHLARKIKAIQFLTSKLDSELTEKIKLIYSIKWNYHFLVF